MIENRLIGSGGDGRTSSNESLILSRTNPVNKNGDFRDFVLDRPKVHRLACADVQTMPGSGFTPAFAFSQQE